MDTQTPPPYSGYYRPQSQQDIRSLQMLRQAYFGVQWLIGTTLLVGFGGRIAMGAIVPDAEKNLGLVIALFLAHVSVLLIVNFIVAFRSAKLVAGVKGLGTGYAVALSLGAAILSPLCFGVFGCMVIQGPASTEFNRLGVPSGILSTKKAHIDAKIAQLEANQAMPPAPDFGP